MKILIVCSVLWILFGIFALFLIIKKECAITLQELIMCISFGPIMAFFIFMFYYEDIIVYKRKPK